VNLRLRLTSLAFPATILAAGVGAYLNSFSGVFLFDDHRSIVPNYQIRSLWPPTLPLIVGTSRPVIHWSLALNYACGGLHVFGYHLVNLTIHLLAALMLYGLIRRTLLTPRLRETYGAASSSLALVVTLLWVVHPIQTQSVTYVIQRAESLAGLCYLLTVYCAIRSVGAMRPRWWHTGAILACALGMGTKPVVVTAPLMVLLYDRIFLAGSVRAALRERWVLYRGLMATWALLAALQATEFNLKEPSAGFRYKDVTWLGYALTQPGVLLHYLRLSLWPDPLMFDYLWPVARLHQLFGPLLIMGTLIGATLWALRHRPVLGFVGAWFFLILAPSSSVIPIADLAAEHRMYLPLAAVMTLLVFAGHRMLQWACGTHVRLRRAISTGMVVTLAAVLMALTVHRNRDYGSEAAMWSDVLVKRPNHFRALSSLGDLMRRQGRFDDSVLIFAEALRVAPENAESHYNLGFALVRVGRLDEALTQYDEALRLNPDHAEAHNNVGIVLKQQGKLDEAIAHYADAIRLDPDYADAHYNLANAFLRQGRLDEALAHYTTTLRLQPDDAEYAQAHASLGNIFLKRGELERASVHYQRALALEPTLAEAHNNLGAVLAQQGKLEEAVTHYAEAFRLAPSDAIAYNLAKARQEQRRAEQAQP